MDSSSADPPRPEDVALVEAADPAIGELTTTHLARFEFSDAGTKILMVEWVPQAVGSAQDGSGVKDEDAPWEVSWPGKQTFLPARDSDHQLSPTALEHPSSPNSSTRRRIFFLLPPASSVPAEITLTPPGRQPITLKPLPAIFPEASSSTKLQKRLRELQKEIDDELRNNAEGVAVEMAIAEKQWITDNFLPRPAEEQQLRDMGSAGMTPISPRSPIGGRMGEKLKGLRLGTSPADLVPGPKPNTFTNFSSQSQTLSPTGGDVAVSSFSSIPRSDTGSVGAPAAAPISLDAAVHGDTTLSTLPKMDDEDGLFALPISPRSPDMKVMPFSQLR